MMRPPPPSPLAAGRGSGSRSRFFLCNWDPFSRAGALEVINITNRNAQIAQELARNFGVLFLGVGATVAVLGDDRFSDTHASQHCDIYHNGSSGFGGNADIA